MLTNDPRFHERAEIIREKGTNRSQFFRGMVDKYTWMEIGSSYIPSDILSAFLFAQLENMALITQARLNIYNKYAALLQPLATRGLLQLPTIPQHCESNYHMFYILLEDIDIRSRLIEHLQKDGILAVFHYIPLHSSPVGEKMGYRREMLPITNTLSERLLRLPMFYELTERDVEKVVESIRQFFKC